MNFKELDECTLYIECLPLKYSLQDIKTQFQVYGSIKDVTIPLKSNGTYAFVTFESKESTRIALMDSKYVSFQQAWERKDSNRYWRGFYKSEWDKRTLEYLEKIEKDKERVLKRKLEHIGSHPSLVFIPNVICKFKNVHFQANSKSIKFLFEMVAPVAFIEYSQFQNPSREGYIRFKSEHGAQLACIYFAREYVYQSHSKCTGILISPNDSQDSQDSQNKKDRIELNLLDSKEQQDYWKFIQIGKKDSKKFKRMEPLQHIFFD